jgi:hypothetical protein
MNCANTLLSTRVATLFLTTNEYEWTRLQRTDVATCGRAAPHLGALRSAGLRPAAPRSWRAVAEIYTHCLAV